MAVKLIDNSAAIIAKFNEAKQKALVAIAFTAEGHAKGKTPTITGRLKNSIGNAVAGDSAVIGTNVEYGPYVEFGTRNRPGVHMIQRACQDHASEYKDIAEAAFTG